MMDKQQQITGRRMRISDAQWPPKNTSDTSSSPVFYRVANEHGVKKVAWPPRSGNRSIDYNNHSEEFFDETNPEIQSSQLDQDRYGINTVRGRTPTPPGVVTHPLRETLPVKQSPVATVPSQPFIRSSTPTRKMGDQVWPPKKSGNQVNGDAHYQHGIPDAKPKKLPQKDYKPFFSRHRIPSSCPVAYWVPPGTQHVDQQ